MFCFCVKYMCFYIVLNIKSSRLTLSKLDGKCGTPERTRLHFLSPSKNKREAIRPLFFTDVRKPTSRKGMPSFLHGLSHGLKIARQLSIFAPVCALVPPFQVLCICQKRPHRMVWSFLAGALGLEPRAYGFGDRRSTN